MSKSLIEIIKSGTPAPRIVLLPDTCFFVRNLPLADPAGSVPDQVDLALEALSPFPVPQLLHGHYAPEGSSQALVFAAYRRRFTVDEVDAWVKADWVAPSFCILLGHKASPGTTLLYPGQECLTAIHWGAEGFPSRVVVRPVPTDTETEQVARLREEVLSEVGRGEHLIELAGTPTVRSSEDEGVYLFEAGDLQLRIPVPQAMAMDVRPKEDLQGLIRSRRRSLLLWRTIAGFAACLGLLCVGELVLFGTRFLHKANQRQAEEQRPLVTKIMTSQSLAFRIDELATRRLLPFEMISVIAGKKPKSIQFLRSSTTGLLGLKAEAVTSNSADIASYQAALQAHPSIQSADVSDLSSRDRTTRFTLQVTFKQGALAPATTQ